MPVEASFKPAHSRRNENHHNKKRRPLAGTSGQRYDHWGGVILQLYTDKQKKPECYKLPDDTTEFINQSNR